MTANQRPSGSLNAKLRTPLCSPISIACTYCDDMGAPRRITMDEAFALTKSWGAVRDALTHEMGHVWQAAMGLDLDHGPSFHQIAKRLGISERAVD